MTAVEEKSSHAAAAASEELNATVTSVRTDTPERRPILESPMQTPKE
ncbi:hypothetical protein [Telmatospirillum siberiense]|nr:hypothetical protein [Telmatospirillum siberiense]